MQTLIIIRHAPTAENEKGIFMGHHDTPNSESGLLKAQTLRKTLKLSPDVRFFTSPLQRSKATLDSILPKGKKVVDSRLIERNLGKWEGCSKNVVKCQYPDAFVDDNLDPMFTPPGGEHVESFVLRICDFLIDISDSHEQSDALSVTHNGVIAVMRSLIEERSLRECFAEVEPFLKPRICEYDRCRVIEFLPKLIESLHIKM